MLFCKTFVVNAAIKRTSTLIEVVRLAAIAVARYSGISGRFAGGSPFGSGRVHVGTETESVRGGDNQRSNAHHHRQHSGDALAD